MKARKAKKAPAKKPAEETMQAKIPGEVEVRIIGPSHVCKAACILLKQVFSAIGYRMGDIKDEPLPRPKAPKPAKAAPAEKKPAGRPVKKSEIRQWQSWRKKGASYSEIARRSGRPRSVVTKYAKA